MDPKEILNELPETNSFEVSGLEIIITPHLADLLKRNKKQGKKFCNSLRYGYIGPSRGGKNGITNITKRDHGINSRYEGFVGSEEYIDLVTNNKFSDPIGVKVVAHVPSGNRMVGMYDQEQSKAIFFDIWRY